MTEANVSAGLTGRGGAAAGGSGVSLPANVRELEDVVARALEVARAAGATGAEIGLAVDAGLSVSVRLGEVESLEYQRDRGLGVTVYVGQRKGSARTVAAFRPATAFSKKVRAVAAFARWVSRLRKLRGLIWKLGHSDRMGRTSPRFQ